MPPSKTHKYLDHLCGIQTPILRLTNCVDANMHVKMRQAKTPDDPVCVHSTAEGSGEARTPNIKGS